jgi:hypothetical protein
VEDTTPPTLTLTAQPDAETSSTTATFEWTTDEPVSKVRCSLDSEAFTDCVSGLTFTGLAAGAHQLRLVPYDMAGNRPATMFVNWTIVVEDTTPPTLTLTAQPDAETSSTTATFEWTTDEPVSKVRCSLDSEAFTDCVSGLTFTGLAAGAHQLRLVPYDMAGNRPATMFVNWTITS